MKIKTDPASIFAEYQKGVQYDSKLELFDTIERNENMYIGKCWEGVNAPDLDKPVIPMLQRVVTQFVAMIVSDDIASQIAARQPNMELQETILQREIENIIEDEKMKSKNRLMLRDAAVDGDCCVYCYFDPDAATGQKVLGRVTALPISNTNVIFGNPHEQNAQEQPYILLPMRELVDDLKDQAKKYGASESEIDEITADDDPNEYNVHLSQGDLATAVIKLWMNDETGTVWATKVCGKSVIRKPWDLEYRMYPIAYMSWNAMKNSYRGKSAMEGLIPNQIFVNKLYAMAMHYVKAMAFPKIAYDRTRLRNGISNKVGEAIGVDGDPREVLSTPMVQADMSNQVFVMIDKIIEHTQNFVGASDIALGNARPENTSAIIALTKASAMPLEIQRLNFYQFVEDYIKVFIEIISTDYGVRKVVADDPETGESAEIDFDFRSLRDIDFRLNIDVGQSAYWSELMQLQTNDNMWMQKVIQDPIDYLENLPNGIIKNKNKLIAKFKQLQAAMAQMPVDAEGNPLPPEQPVTQPDQPPMQGGAPPQMM